MKKYKNFYFEKFEFNKENLVGEFFYSFDKELHFKETICFKDEKFGIRNDLNDDVLNNILFHLHIALGVSYYKFYLTEKLIIESGFLDDYQISFWKKFYLNGLGEFFFRNNIDITNLLKFENIKTSPPAPLLEERGEVLSKGQNFYQDLGKKINFKVSEKYLVPVGGGKDSIVSIELLKSFGKKIDLVTFAQNDNILYENTAQISGLERLYIKRELSKNILEVIESGAYNGHVPITGIIAFVLELASYIYDYKFIVLSNEFSANFGNTFWQGIEVNHQYSKSLEFEKDFGDYVSKYISSEVKYFSLLRPFYELKIAELFSKLGKKYFQKFSSCNVNFKIFNKKEINNQNKYWCNACSKCAFVYTILRPFLTQKEVIEIFGKELFEDKSLEKLFRELLGISGIKPFECVGTNEEVTLAMKMSLEKFNGKLPFILEIFKNEVDSKMSESDYISLENKIFKGYFEETIIPNDLLSLLKKY